MRWKLPRREDIHGRVAAQLSGVRAGYLPRDGAMFVREIGRAH